MTVMAVDTAERRARRRSSRPKALELRLTHSDAQGARQSLIAKVVDHTAEGLGIELPAPLPSGLMVTLRPGAELKSLVGELPLRARIQWCVCVSGGGYRAGLTFEQAHSGPRPSGDEPEGGEASAAEDLYEVLMVNPRADFETIHRVYRLQAQRFHPDNGETGDADHFRRLTQAYAVLGNPERRAAYDLSRRGIHEARVRLFTRESGVSGTHAELRKRHGVLAALYRRRFLDPAQPSLTIFDLEDVLEVPREHLEFTLWYLKERGFLQKTDNSRFQITVQGVDEFERLETESLPHDRLLEAPQPVGAGV